MKKILKNKKGFTMIELMVVIVIMLILAAIAIPSFTRLVTQANETAAIAEARTVLMLAQLEVDMDATVDLGNVDVVADILKESGVSDAKAEFSVTEGVVGGTYTSDNGIVVKLPDLVVADE